jgi:hypothetical protein
MVWREDAWEYPLHGLRRCGVDVLLALLTFVCLVVGTGFDMIEYVM